jgi:flagellar protein FlaG
MITPIEALIKFRPANAGQDKAAKSADPRETAGDAAPPTTEFTPQVGQPNAKASEMETDVVVVSEKAVEINAKGDKPERSTSKQMAERIQESVNKIQKRATTLRFDIEENNGEVLVRVVNRESGEMVREIPPEEIRNMIEQLENLRGVLFKDVT